MKVHKNVSKRNIKTVYVEFAKKVLFSLHTFMQKIRREQ